PLPHPSPPHQLPPLPTRRSSDLAAKSPRFGRHARLPEKSSDQSPRLCSETAESVRREIRATEPPQIHLPAVFCQLPRILPEPAGETVVCLLFQENPRSVVGLREWARA